MKSQRGFSLIELLIVTVIIGIVASIAVPNLISSRRAANEGSAVSALRTIYSANMGFAATVGNGSFAGTLSTPGVSPLTGLRDAALIDTALGSGEKSGYAFIGEREPTATPGRETFYFSANPSITSGILATGTKRFGVAMDGVLRSDTANLVVPFNATSLASASPVSTP